MKITRKSQMTGIVRTLDLPVTQEQLDNYSRGALLQNAFPCLTDEEREFVKTGIISTEWDALFGGDEEVKEMYRLDAEADARLLQQEE